MFFSWIIVLTLLFIQRGTQFLKILISWGIKFLMILRLVSLKTNICLFVPLLEKTLSQLKFIVFRGYIPHSLIFLLTKIFYFPFPMSPWTVTCPDVFWAYHLLNKVSVWIIKLDMKPFYVGAKVLRIFDT